MSNDKVMVPVEPTDEMIDAFEGVYNGLSIEDKRLIWSRMIAAAPAAPQPPSEEGTRQESMVASYRAV